MVLNSKIQIEMEFKKYVDTLIISFSCLVPRDLPIFLSNLVYWPGSSSLQDKSHLIFIQYYKLKQGKFW